MPRFRTKLLFTASDRNRASMSPALDSGARSPGSARKLSCAKNTAGECPGSHFIYRQKTDFHQGIYYFRLLLLPMALFARYD